MQTSTRIKWLTRTAFLLAIALVFQMGGFPQPITGPLVNTVLYLAASIVGWQGGILIGILTPLVAAMRGILPPPLAPLIPFIALGNSLMVVLFYLLKFKNKIIAIIIASLVKFSILFSAVNLLVQVPPAVSQMMSLPQLITALTGGIVALLVMALLKKANIRIE
ncbi:MAG: ECF transporter S component [Candidatus Atribacteria bacterium]|nr:ECF transporter S component [Candidatus Atribacteria bacterium]